MGDLDGKVSLDVTNYKAGLSEMNRALRVVESGFKAQSAVMGDWDKNVDGLAMRSQALSREIDLQAHKVSELNRVYRELAAGGKTSQKELDLLQISINQANLS